MVIKKKWNFKKKCINNLAECGIILGLFIGIIIGIIVYFIIKPKSNDNGGSDDGSGPGPGPGPEPAPPPDGCTLRDSSCKGTKLRRKQLVGFFYGENTSCFDKMGYPIRKTAQGYCEELDWSGPFNPQNSIAPTDTELRQPPYSYAKNAKPNTLTVAINFTSYPTTGRWPPGTNTPFITGAYDYHWACLAGAGGVWGPNASSTPSTCNPTHNSFYDITRNPMLWMENVNNVPSVFFGNPTGPKYNVTPGQATNHFWEAFFSTSKDAKLPFTGVILDMEDSFIGCQCDGTNYDCIYPFYTFLQFLQKPKFPTWYNKTTQKIWKVAITFVACGQNGASSWGMWKTLARADLIDYWLPQCYGVPVNCSWNCSIDKSLHWLKKIIDTKKIVPVVNKDSWFTDCKTYTDKLGGYTMWFFKSQTASCSPPSAGTSTCKPVSIHSTKPCANSVPNSCDFCEQSGSPAPKMCIPKLPATNTGGGASIETITNYNYDWCQKNCTGYYNPLTTSIPDLVLHKDCYYICGCLENGKITSNLLGCAGVGGNVQGGKVPFSSFCAPNVVLTGAPVKENFKSTPGPGACMISPQPANGPGWCPDCPKDPKGPGACCHWLRSGSAPPEACLEQTHTNPISPSECVSSTSPGTGADGTWCGSTKSPSIPPSDLTPCEKSYSVGGKCGKCIMKSLRKTYPKKDFCCRRQPKSCNRSRGRNVWCRT